MTFPTRTAGRRVHRQMGQSLEQAFRDSGATGQKISLAWMEFWKPHPAEKIEEFARNGVNQVVYFAVAISADSIHSQHDIPELLHKAQVPVGFVSTNLGTWNDDPIAIKAIKEQIDEQMG